MENPLRLKSPPKVIGGKLGRSFGDLDYVWGESLETKIVATFVSRRERFYLFRRLQRRKRSYMSGNLVSDFLIDVKLMLYHVCNV